MFRSRLVVFFIMLLPNCTFAQGGFKKRIYLPGVVTSVTKAIFETPSGNYIAAGIIVDTINGNTTNRLCLMGLNSQGEQLWVKKYGNNKFIYINNPFISRSYYFYNNFLYYATEILDSNNVYKGAFLKFDLNGDTIWQKIYSDTVHNLLLQMVTASIDGGFIIVGKCIHATQLNNDPVFVLKTDASGNELWRQKVNKNTPNDHDGKAIIQDSATKKIVIVGYQSKGNATSWSSFDNLLILDSLGAKLSQNGFTGTYGGNFGDLIQTKDKNFVAVGRKYTGQTIGNYRLETSFAAKFNINNPTIPIWTISGMDKPAITNAFGSIRELNNGNLIIAGVLDTMQILNQAIKCLHRFTIVGSNGSIISNRYYSYKTNGAFSDDYQGIISFEKTSDNGIIAAIGVQNIPSPNPLFFVKYDSTGCDSTLIYCSNPVGLNDEKTQNVEFTLYPNPASEYIQFQYTLNVTDLFTRFVIYNSLGQIMREEAIEFRNKRARIQINDLSSGVYSIELKISPGQVIKRRFLVAK